MMIEMKVTSLTIDQLTSTPIAILKNASGDKAIPIWVGIFEASAIAMELERITVPRPLTHDLMYNIIKTMRGKVSKIEMYDIKHNTFYANIYIINDDGSEVAVDTRPSDAIAIALRARAPIFVAEKVIELSREIDIRGKLSREEIDKMKDGKLKDFLDNLAPEDFGKYKM